MQNETTEAVYHFIVTYMEAHDGLAPSQREIAEACYIARSAVIRHIDRLEAWGRIIRDLNKARSIRLPKAHLEEN
jgi:DNA-binding MarR family transcriptional regulator